MRGIVAIGIALACAGCGTSAVVDGRSSAPPYDGPMTGAAAAGALECEGEKKPYRRAEGSYDLGLESVQASPEAAFDDYVERSSMGLHVPVEGYRVERREARAALLSYDVGDRTRVAVFLADGIRDFDGDEGWGVEVWAQCDPAEFPAGVTEGLNLGIWEDAAGRRVPARRVRSFQGPEHCSWTDITFLLVGPDDRAADWYVRDPRGELSRLVHGAFDPAAELPEGATDTGWRRGGRQLWLDQDEPAAYLVSLDDPRDVERWPGATEEIGCA